MPIFYIQYSFIKGGHIKASDLTIEKRIGQMILPGFPGKKVDEHASRLIKDYNAGNIILFTRNVSDPSQLFYLNKELQETALQENGVPLFIASDEEGGTVSRINNAGYFFPGAMSLTAGGDENDAFEIGRIEGGILSSLGININLAPVLDISSNPEHPAINARSFSGDPHKTASIASAFIKGIQSGNVIATAKHFPGHGHSIIDTHLEKEIVSLDEKRLSGFELIPFIEAIKSDIGAVMSSHVIFKALDPSLPATLSYSILTKLLRQKLNFNGIIFSDCLEMKAVSKYYGTPEAAVKAVQAGVDIVIVSHDFESQTAAIKRLLDAVRKGELDEERINDSVDRILSYKEKINAGAIAAADFESNKKIFSNSGYKDVTKKIYENGISQIKGFNRFYPEEKDTLFIYSEAINLSLVDDSIKRDLSEAIASAFPDFKLKYFPASPDEDYVRSLIEESKIAAQVVVLTYNAYHNQAQIKLIKGISDFNKNIFVISMRNPYDILKFPEINNYAVAYQYTPPAVEAVVKFLEGKIKGNKNCPVNIFNS